jgi:spermidine synthase
MSLDSSQWLTEAFEERTAFSVRYSAKVLDRMSSFQRIEVFESSFMGRILVLGGCFMVTDRDAFVYHEMLVHPAMAVLTDPKRVLIIGGGDGGAVTEVVKYPGVESVTLCEIDPYVVSACQEFFPDISAGLGDPRVQVVNDDGAAYVAGRRETFDLILVDSTDPVGPGKALYELGFYQAVKNGLRQGGIAVFQTESPHFMANVFAGSVSDLSSVFGKTGTKPYLATIPSYPGGLWSFTFCSPERDPIGAFEGRIPAQVQQSLRYYNQDVHRAAFALPVFVRQLLTEERN